MCRWRCGPVRSSLICFRNGKLAATPWSAFKKEKPAWKIGLYHMILNLLVALLFAINLGLRVQTFREATTIAGVPLLLSILGTALLIGSAYLGGMMTYTYGISVARMSKDKWRKIAVSLMTKRPP